MEKTFDQFVEEYKPETNKVLRKEHDSNIADGDVAPICGFMYETYGEELEVVREALKKNPKTVWTVLDGDDGELFISSGMQFVNRFGYIITETPCELGKFGMNINLED